MIWEVETKYPRTGIYNTITSIKEQDNKHGIKIFPNPVNHLLFIQPENDVSKDELDYTVYNCLRIELFDGTGNTVDTQKLTRGLYVLKIFNQYIKFIKD